LIDLDTGAPHEVVAEFDDGHPACVRHGAFHYCAGLFDEALTQQLFADVAARAGLHAAPLPEGVRVSRRAGVTYVFNYGERVYDVEGVESAAFVIGDARVEPQGVCAYRSG
jgi:beta-galactosidase